MMSQLSETFLEFSWWHGKTEENGNEFQFFVVQTNFRNYSWCTKPTSTVQLVVATIRLAADELEKRTFNELVDAMLFVRKVSENFLQTFPTFCWDDATKRERQTTMVCHYERRLFAVRKTWKSKDVSKRHPNLQMSFKNLFRYLIDLYTFCIFWLRDCQAIGWFIYRKMERICNTLSQYFHRVNIFFSRVRVNCILN